MSESGDSAKRSSVSSNRGSPSPSPVTTYASSKRSGKAPPIDSFSGESEEILFDDWLPSLDRTSEWNGWKEEEKLLQLAGHLRGKALQEWNLIEEKDSGSVHPQIPSLSESDDKNPGQPKPFLHCPSGFAMQIQLMCRHLSPGAYLSHSVWEGGHICGDKRCSLIHPRRFEG